MKEREMKNGAQERKRNEVGFSGETCVLLGHLMTCASRAMWVQRHSHHCATRTTVLYSWTIHVIVVLCMIFITHVLLLLINI